MKDKDNRFFDRFSGGDVYKKSPKQLKKFCSKALCRIQPNTAEQEPWLMTYHKVMKRIREMYCDELKQTISWLEKEKTNFQPLPRLERLKQRIERLKKRLDEAEQQLGYSLNPWWRK
jgi:predicted nuclease with TOPRIM domain